MSVLVVDYGALSNLNSTATRLASIFQNRVDNYEGIVNKVNSIPTSRSNLENANYFIKKKNEQCQTKINKLNLFNTKISEFSEKSVQTDKRVASRITSDTNVFKKAKEINISTLAVMGDSIMNMGISLLAIPVLGGNGLTQKDVRGLKYGIKDLYRKDGNRFIVEVVKDVFIAGVIATVVIGTVLSGGALLPLLGATLGAQLCTGFALFSGACSMGYDIAALSNYNKTKDRKSSRLLDKKGGSEVSRAAFGGAGYGLAYAVGVENQANQFKKVGEKAGETIFSGLTTASCVYGGAKVFAGGYGFRKGFKKTFADIKGMGNMAGKSGFNVFQKTTIAKGIKNDFKLGFGAKGINWEVNVSKKLFGANSTFKKAFFNLGANGAKSITKETLMRGSIKDVMDGVDAIKKGALEIGDRAKNMQMKPSMP